MQSTFHDDIHGVVIALVHAERMAGARPQHAKSLMKFRTGLERLWKEVVANVLRERKRAKKPGWQ